MGRIDEVESVYIVTIRNTGDDRALSAHEVKRACEEYAGNILHRDDVVSIEVETP